MSNPTEYVVSGHSGQYLAVDDSGKALIVDSLDEASRFATVTDAARAIGSITGGNVISYKVADVSWAIKRLVTVTRHELEDV